MTDFKDIEPESLNGKERKPEDLSRFKVEHKELRDVVPELTFGQKLRLKLWQTVRGKTVVGQIGYILLPEKVKNIVQTVTKTEKPMLQKILNVKNFINVRDEDGNFSWQEVAASAIQLALAAALAYGLDYLGVFDQFMQLVGQ